MNLYQGATRVQGMDVSDLEVKLFAGLSILPWCSQRRFLFQVNLSSWCTYRCDSLTYVQC